MKKFLVVILAVTMLGCAKKVVQAPVPGSLNSLDAWSYRIVSDAGASIHSIKIWEQCSDSTSPKTVVVDGTTENCDPTASPFPMEYKPQLNQAIAALNTASALGKAYHSGASNDTAGLTSAINQLTAAITQLISQIGGKH